jgi:hypothetical protein
VESLFVPLFFVAFPASIAVVGALLAFRAGVEVARRRILLGFAWTLIAVPLAFFLMMLIGEAISDLGAGPVLAAVGPWLLAALAFVVLAWTRPTLTLGLLAPGPGLTGELMVAALSLPALLAGVLLILAGTARRSGEAPARERAARGAERPRPPSSA